MRPLYVATLCVTLLASACGENDADRRSAEQAIDAASLAVQSQLITSVLADIASTTPIAESAQERAELLASGVDKVLDCGAVQAQGSAVRVTFDGLGCVVRDMRLWGEVLIDVSTMPQRASLVLSEVSDGSMTLTGSSSLTIQGTERLLEDQVTLTPNGTGTSYAVLDRRIESVSITGPVIHTGSRCAAQTSSASSCALSDESEPRCINVEGDCLETHTTELELAWTQDVAQRGDLSSHRVTLPGFTREVELAYGAGETLKAHLDAALRTYVEVGTDASLNSNDYFHGRCPHDDSGIVAEPGFICVATLVWVLEAVEGESDAALSSGVTQAAAVQNFFKFWVSSH